MWYVLALIVLIIVICFIWTRQENKIEEIESQCKCKDNGLQGCGCSKERCDCLNHKQEIEEIEILNPVDIILLDAILDNRVSADD